MEKKLDLSDCTIVIPLHIDFPERLEHLRFLLRYFTKFFINHQLILVEQDVKSKIDFPLPPEADLEFITSEEDFSITRVSNSGAELVKTAFFCKCDTDLLVHPKAIFDAFERLKTDSSTSLVLPYNGISFNLTSPLKEDLMHSCDFQKLPCIQREEIASFSSPHLHLKCGDSQGLIHCFRTSVFKTLGGYNEEFIGWGYDDNEVLARFKGLGHPKEMLKGYNAFHLDHPRMYGGEFQVLQNFHRWQRVEKMPRDELVDYVKTWTRFGT